MYVGLTKNGMWRYRSHLAQESGASRNWIHDMMCDGHAPFHVILERSTVLKELQVQEVLFVKALKLMGEDLVNGTDGGEAGTSRNPTQEGIFRPVELVAIRQFVNETMAKPSQELIQTYRKLTKFAKSLGGFQPEIEKYKALLAKSSLCVHATEPISNKAEVVSKKICSVSGCGKDHHGKGLCRSHGDKQRREQRKLEKKQSQVLPPESLIRSESILEAR